MNKKIMAIVAVIALVAILGICLVACNADSYSKKLEDAGYVLKAVDSSDYDESKTEWSVYAVKGEISLTSASVDKVTVMKFKETDDAKEWEEAKIKIWGEKGVSRIGKIVIYGTEQGVKDAK